MRTCVSIVGSQRIGNIVTGAFTPVLAKHSKSFSLIDCVSVGVEAFLPPLQIGRLPCRVNVCQFTDRVPAGEKPSFTGQ